MDSAVTFLMENVTKVIRDYTDLISKPAAKEFERLNEDVDSMRHILKDLDNKPSDEACGLQNQIREVIYEVEDTIDSWLTQAAASKGKSKFMRGLRYIHHSDNSLVKQVKALRVKVKEVLESARRMNSFQGNISAINEDEVNETRTDRRPISTQEMVGLEDVKDKITGYLMRAQPELDIISIIGMPGLGKTALAWQIFNDERICFEFSLRIWIYISQRMNRRDVLVQIMKHFTHSDDMHKLTDQELISAVHACLSREKFLLVMDDIWEKEHWDEIKSALPYSNMTSKVMITSRDMVVGRNAQQFTEPHKLRPLNLNESWELLKLVVFGKSGDCPIELEVTGQNISVKCKGVPLSIVVIGGVLRDQYLSLKSNILVKRKWEEMARNESLALEDKWKIMYDSVALSYNRLPYRLRDCFLYLGVFPAGYEIPTWTLMRLWIAEGFIQPDERRSLEEIAEDYLNDLISRNLLMVRKMNPMCEVKVCLVQDMIREFCISKAAQQNMFQEIKMEEESTGALVNKMEKIHRLCLHSDLDKFFSANLKGPRVRSFLCFRKDVISLEQEHNWMFLANFTSLRILHSKSINFGKFPPKVTKLDHLRYIVLCVPDLVILPEPLSQLWNLQTIVVDTNSNSLTMKANLWKMFGLRHVKTKAAIVLDKKLQGEAGENLHTLNRLSPESVTRTVSKNARNLNTLGIRGELASLFDDMSLENLNRLKKLKLYHAGASGNRLRRFPDYNRFPPNLKRLTLSNTFLDWKHMSSLAMFPNLEVLKLKDNAFTGIVWEATSYVFNQLVVLLIRQKDLVLWEAAPSTFPCLIHLVLKDCEHLKEIPGCVLQHLENLEIERVRQSAVDSARNSGAKFKLTIGSYVI